MNGDGFISRRAFIASTLLTALSARSANAQGFAGLGVDAAEFASVLPGHTLAFPRDHGAHPDYRIEWWYLTANLRDPKGAEWGAQWTLFRQAMTPGLQGEGWSNQQIWMGHAAITSATTHHSAERFARGGVGQAGVNAWPFEAFIDEWHMRSASSSRADTLAPMSVAARGQDFAYTLQLEAGRPLVLQGDQGYSRKSERGQASYYYSQPYFTATGTLKVAGSEFNVQGHAWMDREWSSQPLASDQTGWDWFSLHLANGQKLMLFRLRQKSGENYFAGNLIEVSGTSRALANDAISMQPLAYTQIGARKIPTGWRVQVASEGIDLTTTPLNPNAWMDTTFAYWEGPITATGSMAAIGYLEMTGY